jgi:hypothetical protein
LIDDIYNPDGQLTQKLLPEEHVAPEAIQKYLQVPTLGLRDSNWSPDFPTAGKTFLELYEKATGIKPNWIIGVNLFLVEDLLAVVGSLQLPVTNTTVTAQNLFEQAEIASEVSFVPGSTGKRDFLTEVAQQLWLQLFPLENEKLAAVATALTHNIQRGELVLYSAIPAWQETIQKLDLAGEIPTITGDYVYVVSSNVGGNKANYWIDRSTDYSVFVDRDGNLRSKLTVRFAHSGTSETWPGGTYKDYLRVYVPLGSSLVEAQGFSDEATVQTEFDKTVMGGLVEVPIQSSREVTLTYTLPTSINVLQDKTYQLYFQAQPGLKAEDVHVALGIPPFLTVTNTSPLGRLEGENIVWDLLLEQEEVLHVTFSEPQ